MLGTAISAAASVGLGCGSCCGTTASSILAVYILSEGGGFKSSLKHVGGFFLGKILAVCSITMLCAAIGNVFIDENGRAKVDVALCRGKKQYDKRQSLKEKEDRREMDRAFKISI